MFKQYQVAAKITGEQLCASACAIALVNSFQIAVGDWEFDPDGALHEYNLPTLYQLDISTGTHAVLNGFQLGYDDLEFSPSPLPVPAAVWLFGTALLGFVGMSRGRKVA